MGFRLEIDGAGPVKLTERAITSVKFGSEHPQDSNARATDNGASIKIWGKLLFSLGGEEQDSTLNLAQWSLVPSESPDSYRNVQGGCSLGLSDRAPDYPAQRVCGGVC